MKSTVSHTVSGRRRRQTPQDEETLSALLRIEEMLKKLVSESTPETEKEKPKPERQGWFKRIFN